MLRQFEQSIKGATVVRGSSSALPITSNSLGGVNCSDALQALPDPQQAFLEIARCMRPGAVFTGFTFLEASWPYSYFQHRLHYAKRRLFTVKEITDFLVNSNLEMVDFTVIERVIFFTAKKPLN
jgi:ubiquinone/menaquinone biosynthesis C-methylase UbiE